MQCSASSDAATTEALEIGRAHAYQPFQEKKCGFFFRVLVSVTAIAVLMQMPMAATVTPYNGGITRQQPDSPTWVSETWNAGAATAFDQFGNLTSPNHASLSGLHIVFDGGDYEETISGAAPTCFEWDLDLNVETRAKVDPHVVDGDTTYRTEAAGFTSVRVWLDGSLELDESDTATSLRVPEQAAEVTDNATYGYAWSMLADTMHLEWRVGGSVSLSTNRSENTIHGRVRTLHGDPADPIGYVQKYANGTPVGSQVQLH